MTRYTIDIDRKLLLEVKAILGTPTLRETVRVAVRNLVESAEREKRSQQEARRSRILAERKLRVALREAPGGSE